ncbi:MAG TPA: hypothetical protein VII49_10235 [Rhizomicrobium sp.]
MMIFHQRVHCRLGIVEREQKWPAHVLQRLAGVGMRLARNDDGIRALARQKLSSDLRQ